MRYAYRVKVVGEPVFFDVPRNHWHPFAEATRILVELNAQGKTVKVHHRAINEVVTYLPEDTAYLQRMAARAAK
jgi:hypothetical protein